MRRAAAPAKLNLALHLTGRRADGYHELASLMAFTSLADGIHVESAPELSLQVSGPFAHEAGPGEGNLVLKAARLLQQESGTAQGARIALEKNIPVGGGLGGGSSDAAAALVLLNQLWQLGLSDARLHALAPQLGADVAVCLAPSAYLARGIGEVLESLPTLPLAHAVLVHPRKPLLTKDVYAATGALSPEGEGLVQAVALLRDGANAETFYTHLAQATRNDLQRPAIACMPEVAEILLALETAPQRPLLVRMTGSGACCFALYAHEKSAEAVAAALRSSYPRWWVATAQLR